MRPQPARGFSFRGSSPDAGERAFAYAKACGIIGKSFVGKRIAGLGKLRSLSELDRLIFPGVYRDLPDRELLADLERRILQRTAKHILSIINSYSRPPELLVRQLRSCEYADLKACLHNISSGMKVPPGLIDIGCFRTVRFEAYPDLAAMLNGTEFEFILEKDLKALQSTGYDFAPLDAELDLRYYTLLVQSAGRLSAADRFLIEQILEGEISLRNCAWALRLRGYYKKTVNETAQHLIDLKMPGGKTSLAAEAHISLNFSMDFRSDWKGWRWEKLLNPEKAGESWAVDPRYFQNAASQYLYRFCLRRFRHIPFSISFVFCYIKLKQFEEDLLTSIAEGLGLGMTSDDVFHLLEAAS